MKAIAWISVWTMGVLVGAVLRVPSSAAVSQASPSPTPASLEQRLKAVEDHIQIEQLLMEYGRDLDARDFAAYASLFAENGVWSGNIGTFTGPANIRAAMEKAFRSSSPGGASPPSFHLLTNAIIDVRGDRATAVSKWTFVRVVGNKPAIALAGRYEDVLVRERGRWRFLRRVAPAISAPPAK